MLQSGSTFFRIDAPLNEPLENATAACLVSANFRVPKYGQISYTEVPCEARTDMVFNIRALEWEEIKGKDGTCLLPLFNHGIVDRLRFRHSIPKGRKGD